MSRFNDLSIKLHAICCGLSQDSEKYRLLQGGICTGYRTYLDSASSEWNSTTTEEKQKFFGWLNDEGVSVKEFIDIFKEFWTEKGRPDIGNTAQFTINSYLPSMLVKV